MGLFDRFTRPDPRRDLERARKLLTRGEAAAALRLAERAGASDPGAAGLVAEAREVLVSGALESAARAMESEYWEDAAQWLEGILEHAGERRGELEQRIAQLRQKEAQEVAEAEAAKLMASAGTAETHVEATAEEGDGIDLDTHYEILADTLRDEVAERYRDRPAEFRRALVELNQNEPQAALETLEALAEADPDDAVLRLERGRCRLAKGDDAGARADLEAAWRELGDGPLDLAGNVSVPSLWAQAMLQLGENEALVERLKEVADPRRDDLDLAEAYARALLELDEPEEARSFLEAAWSHHASSQELARLLALALHRLERRPQAIAVLERSIAPSCAAGSCSKPPLHLPSVKTLVGMILEEGRGLERGLELLALLAPAAADPEVRSLTAAYAEQTADPQTARRAAAFLGSL